MKALTYWQLGSPDNEMLKSAPLWVKLELHSLIKPYSSLLSLLFTKPISSLKLLSHSKVVRNSITILTQIKKLYNIPSVSVHTPICHNHAFTPSILDNTFSKWHSKGIKCIKDVYLEGRLASFTELKSKYCLSQSSLFQYLQLKNFMKDNIAHYENYTLLETLSLVPTSKKLIAKFANCFRLPIESSNPVKTAWENELKNKISEQQWKKALLQIHNCSINSRLRLIQFKVIHRFYYCKVSLHKFYPDVSPLCDKCKSAEGSLLHSFWECPLIQQFWSSIFFFYSAVYQRDIAPDRDMVLFGCSMETQSFPQQLRSALVLGTVVAKRLILAEWKTSSAPRFNTWLNEIVNIISLEKLRFINTGTQKKWEETWTPLLKYLNS